MAENKKKIAVIGFGGMGKWHVRHLLASDVALLAGVFDIDPDKYAVIDTDEQYKGVNIYPSLEAVLDDAEVDAVTIAVPNDRHSPIAIAAMRAGKNVICEKPVCMDSCELQSIIDVSRETGKVFTVHQNRRWDCDYLMMKQAYESGKLGEVFCVESRYHGSRGIPGDWRGYKKYGGGMILDWGVHLIDQMLGIVSDKRVESVYCRCDHITNGEVDDGFKLELYFEKGTTAHIEVGTSHFLSMPRFFMVGTRGAAKITDWRDDCHVVCCDKWEEKDVQPVVTAAGLTRTMAPRDQKTTTESYIERPESDVHEFYRNFCLAIDGKVQQLVTHAQVMRVMKIMEAAFESDRLGAPVKIDDQIC